MRNPANVYPEQGQKASSSSKDLEEYIVKNQSRALLDEMWRTRQAARSRGPKMPVQLYLAVHHQLPFVNDAGGNNLTFRLTPEMIQKVQEASERFVLFEKRTGRSHSKKKKTANDKQSEEDSDEAPEVTTTPKRWIWRQSSVVFNDLLKKLIGKLLQHPGDEF
jgi:hypothetical protein